MRKKTGFWMPWWCCSSAMATIRHRFSEIAKEAGIGKGTVYLYFKSKDEIVAHMFMRELSRHNMKWFDFVMEDPEGGLLHRMYINQLKAIVTSDLMQAIFKKDSRIFGNYLKKKDNFFSKNSSSTIGESFVRMMQDVNCIRRDVDPKLTAHIIDAVGFGITGISEIKDAEDMPEIDQVIDAVSVMMDRAFTPEDGGNSDEGKKVLKAIFDQAIQEADGESEASHD